MNGRISRPIALAIILAGAAVFTGCDTYSPASERNATEGQTMTEKPRFQVGDEGGFVLPPDSLTFHSTQQDTTGRGED